ncbi:MAG: nicotinate (nicotinamide) nucleotide adenylyltransferase [Bacteroidales bacterium]|nr:nicotinate (nicotinamide) nucleotide adenylyltransferase [Candidatus Cryptobacteroides onthequi]
MRIAVYSGSFNPLHIGHQAIMEYLTRQKEFDWVYLVVSPQNPFKAAENNLTARDRYDAAVAAVKRHPELNVWVDDIELSMEPPHYTIRTLDALKKREPQNDFTLVIGADNLESIHKWRDFPRLLSEYGVAVYPRRGTDLDVLRRQLYEECLKSPAPYVLDPSGTYPEGGMINLEDDFESLYHITILDQPMVDISSTEIREAISRGEDVSRYLM